MIPEGTAGRTESLLAQTQKAPHIIDSTPHRLATRRDDFLLAMYRAAWDNVTQAEDTLWKVMAAYTAVFAALAFASSTVGLGAVLLLVVVFGLFGAAVSQNANLWFIRNMGMISNIERQFLFDDDYGRIIPERWKRGKVPFVNREIWWIMTVLFFSISAIALGASYFVLQHPQFSVILWVLGVGTLLVFLYSLLKLYPSYLSIKNTPPETSNPVEPVPTTDPPSQT